MAINKGLHDLELFSKYTTVLIRVLILFVLLDSLKLNDE